MSALDRLAAQLGELPDLADAACRGRADLFDEAGADEDREEAAYRYARAAAACQSCPVLGACRAWTESLPKRHRPPGVLAGHKPSLSAGRPRKETA